MAKRKTKAELAMGSDAEVFRSRLQKAAEGLDRGQVFMAVKTAVDKAWATGLTRDKMIDIAVGDLIG